MDKQSENKADQLPELLRELKTRGDGYRTPAPEYFARMAKRAMETAKDHTSKRSTEADDVVRLQSSQAEKHSKPAKLKPLRRWPQLAAIAASLLLLLWWQPWQTTARVTPTSPATAETTNASTETLQLAQINEEDILAYIEYNISDFEIETLTDDE